MEDLFFTKNLFVASFLLCSSQVGFIGTRQLDQKTKLFSFSPKDIAQAIEADYFRGGKVSAKDLFSNYNTLKDLLFQRESNGGTEYGIKK